MDSQGRVLLIAIVVISLGLVGLWFKPTVEERLAPEPVRSWVAIEPEGAGVADIGPVHLDAGDRFTLHAVLEAAGRNGKPIYYTRAPGLRFVEGGSRDDQAPTSRPVPASSLRVWDRGPHVKVRWFTIEGPRPYLKLVGGDALGDFALETFFQIDWSTSWSVPGEIEGGFANHLNTDDRAERMGRDFGTQRYHVRIELYEREDSTMAAVRIPSGGPEELARAPQAFPTVVASLPGALAGPSRVFGLTQIEPPSSLPAGYLAVLRSLAENRLAFSRLTVLRDQLRLDDDGTVEGAAWRTIDLGATHSWGDTVGPGDLLRVGERVVVLFRDQGVAGELDYQDLCFDFVRGAAVRALGDVFSGEGLVVELYRTRP